MSEPMTFDYDQAADKLGAAISASWLKAHIKELPHRKFGLGTGRSGRVGFTQGDLDLILARFAVTPDEQAANDGRITRRRSA